MRKGLLIFFCLVFVLLPYIGRAEDICEKRLDHGIKNADINAYMMITQACENRAEAVPILKKALSCSPQLPAVYFGLARASFSPSVAGLLDSVDYLVQGLTAYGENFWWTFNLAGSLGMSLMFSLLLAVFITVIMRGGTDLPLVAHDIREGNIPAGVLILMILLSALSPLLFLACMLMLLGLYMKPLDKTVVYGFLLLLVLSPFFFKAATVFVDAFSSGKVKAVAEVNGSRGNAYALAVLRDGKDYHESFSYALALKREGQYDEAIKAYKGIAEERPDAGVFNNLANCYVGLYHFEEARKGQLDTAIQYYNKALSLSPLAVSYYNLSQVSRELLDFSKGNEYFQSALARNRDEVRDLRLISARRPNRFVADKTFPPSELWRYALSKGGKISTFGASAVSPFLLSLLGLGLSVSYFLLRGRPAHRAYRCRKCGTILCPECEKRLTWGRLCPRCYGSIIKLDELEVKERVARLLAIYERQRRRRAVMKVLSFVLPGAAEIYAGKILYGFLFLWSFLFFLSIPMANAVLAPNGVVLRQGFFSWAALLLAAGVYVISNIISRRRIATGWL